MPLVDSLSLVIILIGLGILFFLIALVILRAVPGMRPAVQTSVKSASSESDSGHEDGVILVQTGGRVSSLNQHARKVFNLTAEEMPNLERLARQVRPSEPFLGLCSTEGQGRFILEGKALVVTSYRLTVAPEPVMAVVVRFQEQVAGLGDAQSQPAAQNLQLFTELSLAMAGSLELETTLKAIHQSVAKFIPADFCEIALWNEENETLSLSRFIGPPGTEQKIEVVRDLSRKGQGLAGYLAQERTPLLVGNLENRSDLTEGLDSTAAGLRSFAGVPLTVDSSLVGTLGVGSVNKDAFQEDDLALLVLLSGQAGLALHNALRYRKEQRRAAELSGLAQLTQAIGVVRDPRSMFKRLVESISPLVNVDILGFLLYNDTNRSLEGQEPFQGLPEQFVQIYRVPIPAGSNAEQMLLDQDVILTENAAEAQEWDRLGLSFLAKAASLKDTALIPLNSSGRMLGYLQVSNHKDGSQVFSQDELHLLMIISNQAAPIIENATLVRQARQRAQRAEALRRISSLVSSSANLQEILKFSLQELARLLNADAAGLFLLDQKRGELVLHRDSLHGKTLEIEPEQTTLSFEDPQYPFTVTGANHPLVITDLNGGSPVIPFYQRLAHGWGIASAVSVPLVVRDEGIGEIWLGDISPNAFDQADVQVIATAAGQLAGVIEQGYLREQTDDSLRRQVDQLTALTRISRELSTSLDLDYLLQLVYDEALRTTQADCGSILLFDLSRALDEELKIRVWIGDAPPDSLGEAERRVLQSGIPEIISVTEQMSVPLAHDKIASILVVPVVYQNRPAGLFLLHSTAADRFDESAVEIALSLASQAAVALGNAFQYEEQTQRSALLKRELETLGNLSRLAQTMRSELPVETVLGAIAQAIREATPFQVVLISLFQSETGLLRRIHALGLEAEAWHELRSRSQPWTSMQKLLQPEYQQGNIFFIPADQKSSIPEDVHTLSILPSQLETSESLWNADDFLLVPLYDSVGSPIGLISLDAPADGRRPDRATFEALELFAAQACVIIENHSRLSTLENRLYQLQTQTDQLKEDCQRTTVELSTLQKQDRDQSAELKHLNAQVERVRAGLEIAELANQQGSSDALLQSVAEAMLVRFGHQMALIADNSGNNPRLVGTAGTLPAGINPDALFGQRNPLSKMLQDGQPILIADLAAEKEWNKSPLLTNLGARSLVALPIQLGKGHLAGVMAMGTNPMPEFSGEDRAIFEQMARQVSVSAQNMKLMVETQERMGEVNLLMDFTRNLGIQDPHRMVHALVETALKAIPSAHTGWVALWDQATSSLAPQTALGFVNPESLMEIRLEFVGEPSLPVRVFQSGQPYKGDVSFGKDYNLSSKDLVLYRRATGGRLPVANLLVPLLSGGDCMGVLVLDNINTSGAFSEEDQALALSLAQQTALGLQNARLYAETHRLTQDLERRVDERTTQLRREHNNTQTLLRIITELSTSLEMDLVLTRTLGVLNESVGSQQSLITLSQSPKRYQAGNALVESPVEGKPSLEKEIARWVIRRRSMALVDDITTESRWNVDAEQLPGYRSVLAVPLVLGEEVFGALMLFHRQPGIFISELGDLVEAAARQMAIALNNAELFTLIRDQAENLGGMLRQQQMEASRSRAILESVADGVLVTDADKKITLFNDSAERILGLKAAEVVGKPLSQFSGLFGKASQVWMGTIHQWSENPEAYNPGESYAEQLELENGRVIAINLAAVVFRGKFLATVTIFRDITHEVQVDRLKSEFVANVSHELRTPMTSIKGYVEVMLMGAAGELNPQQRHFLTIVKSNTERLNTLVGDLLDVSRIEAGRIVLNFKPIDLKQIAEEVITEFQRRSKEDNKPMTFLLDAPASVQEVNGDGLRIRQVLSNLVSNGYNYTPASGQVMIRLHSNPDDVQVDVVDNGVGIPLKVQKRIFERFFRGEDPLVLASAGTGLGLAISKIMIEMHHGRIWFTSSGEPGKGSTFSFTLPVKQPEE